MKNLAYLLALHTIDGLGPVRLKLLLDFYKDPKLAWEAPIKEWEVIKVPRNAIASLQKVRPGLDVEKYFQSLKSTGINVVTFFDPDFPKLLKEISDPPLVIYFKGNKELFNKKAIAIVGTRKITGYGRTVTQKITQDLVGSGLVIVSGLARGVDAVSHRAALDNGGETIAVLGTGIKKIYPSENISLSEEIIEKGGLLLGENPPSLVGNPGVFPQRNRIISGLSLGVVVTEAAEDSGSLITARLALEQGREVFAVPGPITSNLSEGPLGLIKEGAKLITSAKDILEELHIDQRLNLKQQNDLVLTEIEKQILDLLENEERHIDEICRKLRKTSGEISGGLIKMEIKGVVKNLGGGVYVKGF